MSKGRSLHYNTDTRTLNASGSIPVDRMCNGFSVKNIGNTVCWVNGDPLQPDESKSEGGNEGEIYGGRIDIVFKSTTQNIIPSVQPLPAVNGAVITQKFYMPDRGFDNLYL